MDDDKQLTQLWDAIAESEPEGSFAMAKHLFHLGYRLDPCPNGKSKPELIARIEAVEAERDKTRNLLRAEHDKAICKGSMSLIQGYRKVHEEREPDCPICTFLAETSSVKL